MGTGHPISIIASAFHTGRAAFQALEAEDPALIVPIRRLDDYPTLVAILSIDIRQQALQRMLALRRGSDYMLCRLGGAAESAGKGGKHRLQPDALLPPVPETRRGRAALDKELEIVRHCFAIASSRYASKYTLLTEVDDAALALALPKITLQPLVENALMHGLLDSGKEEGYGLCNVEKRLCLFFGLERALQLEYGQDGLTILVVPLSR